MAKTINWGRGAGAMLSSFGQSMQRDEEMRRREAEKAAAIERQDMLLQQERDYRDQTSFMQQLALSQREEDRFDRSNPYMSRPSGITEADWDTAAVPDIDFDEQGLAFEAGPSVMRSSQARDVKALSAKPTPQGKTDAFAFEDPYGFAVQGRPTPEMFAQWEGEGYIWGGKSGWKTVAEKPQPKDDGFAFRDPYGFKVEGTPTTEQFGQWENDGYVWGGKSGWDRIGDTEPDANGLGGLTANQRMLYDRERGKSLTESLGTFNISKGDVRAQGAGGLSEEVQMQSGVYEEGEQGIYQIMQSISPIINDLADDVLPNGEYKYTGEEVTSLGMAMLFDANPEAFPATDFNQLDGMSWDKVSRDKQGNITSLNDQQALWKDSKTSPEAAKKEIARLYKSSKNKPFTYGTLINGLEQIGFTKEEAHDLLSGDEFEQLDLEEYAKKNEAPQEFIDEITADKGEPDKVEEINGVWYAIYGEDAYPAK